MKKAPPNSYIENMLEFSQSTWIALPATEVFDLLRHRPYLVRFGADPVLHYCAPLGIWEGAPVHYDLMHGVLRYSWRATVVQSSARHFEVRLIDAFRGPLHQFSAAHVLETEGNGTILRESVACAFVEVGLERVLQSCRVIHALAARRLAYFSAASRETGRLDALDYGAQTA